MKKTLVALVLIMAICLCGACAPNDDNTTQLQEQITQMQQLIDSLSEQMEEEQSNSSDLMKRIEELQRQNDIYKGKLLNLGGLPIEFTESAPVYGPREGEETLAEFDAQTNGNAYQAIVDYIKGQELFEGAVLFKPDNYDVVAENNIYNAKYAISVKDEEIMVKESIAIYDEVFGMTKRKPHRIPRPGDTIGYDKSFELRFYFDPNEVRIDITDDFDIKFGVREINYEHLTFTETYFNLYQLDHCFGTCYYDSYCYLSYTGLEDYLFNRITYISKEDR